MKTRNIFILIITGIILTVLVNSCGTPTSKTGEIKGEISISGAFALYPLTIRWAEEFRKEYPGIRIDISAGGAGKGMADALSGMVDLGMFSRGVTQAEIEKGAWYIAVARDAVLPTINAVNPYLEIIKQQGLDKKLFEKIFLNGEPVAWSEVIPVEGETQNINNYTRADACGAAQMWAEFLGSNQEGLKGIGVFGDPGMADAVKNDKQAMGFNNVVYVYDIQSHMKYPGLEVAPIDINGNGTIDKEEDFYDTLDEVMSAIKDGRYPSPPSRDLYFVAKGKPAGEAVQIFLNWILTEGQNFVNEAGYVQLSKEKIAEELEKMQ